MKNYGGKFILLYFMGELESSTVHQKNYSTILKGKRPVSQQLMLKIKVLFVGLSLFFNISLTFSFSPNQYSCAPC